MTNCFEIRIQEFDFSAPSINSDLTLPCSKKERKREREKEREREKKNKRKKEKEREKEPGQNDAFFVTQARKKSFSSNKHSSFDERKDGERRRKN